MLENVLAVANGKGGVGKTTIAANVAGQAALSGWRVLVCDLDAQGDLGRDLGYVQAGRSDGGQALFDAVCRGQPLKPLTEVREGLDAIAGGEELDYLESVLDRKRLREDTQRTPLEAALREIAVDYDLVLLDCPPSLGELVREAFVTARFILIPTTRDDGSTDGLVRIARMVASVRASDNPAIEVLGVVLFDFGAADSCMIRETRAVLQESLQGHVPVFDTVVRHNRKGSAEMRRLGLLAYEYERAMLASLATDYFGAAKNFSRGAGGLAGDYEALSQQILARYAETLNDRASRVGAYSEVRA
ncbi:MAG: ParA family protein [Nitriliruptorales bacterium]